MMDFLLWLFVFVSALVSGWCMWQDHKERKHRKWGRKK